MALGLSFSRMRTRIFAKGITIPVTELIFITTQTKLRTTNKFLLVNYSVDKNSS